MKMLTVTALVCAMTALTGAASLPEAKLENGTTALQEVKPENGTTGKSHLVKRATSCYSSWTEINGRCFRFIPRALTWARAERNCVALGGNLASIHNYQEHREVQRLVYRGSHEYKETWIGGSDAQQEGHWFWSDGSAFSYNYWCAREPNNFFLQHCSQMNYGDYGCWDDLWCYYERPSVCVTDKW